MRKVDLQGVISKESWNSNDTRNGSGLHIKFAVTNVLFSAVWLENQDVEGENTVSYPSNVLGINCFRSTVRSRFPALSRIVFHRIASQVEAHKVSLSFKINDFQIIALFSEDGACRTSNPRPPSFPIKGAALDLPSLALFNIELFHVTSRFLFRSYLLFVKTPHRLYFRIFNRPPGQLCSHS